MQNFDFSTLNHPENLEETFEKVFSSPNIVSRKWVYEQYDHMVQTNTSVYPGGDAAVVRIKGTRKSIAMKTDGNGRFVYLNPRMGGQAAVAEAARNVVATGGGPLAITNCLNFGNPYKPEMFWQFKQAVQGMGEACKYFNTPVTGGNVSFYNESPNRAVYPTPVIGMIGLVEDIDHITTAEFKNEGDLIYLLGETKEEFGGSEYLRTIFDMVVGDVPQVDLKLEQKHHEFVLDAIRSKLVQSAHDVADGGLAVAFAESCIAIRKKQIGAEINLPAALTPHAWMFSESHARYIISVNPDNKEKFEKIISKHKVECQKIGKVGGDRVKINNWIDLSVDKLDNLYYNIIDKAMEG